MTRNIFGISREELIDGIVKYEPKVTDCPLNEDGRHFVDGSYRDLTSCSHGDTGDFGQPADGHFLALLWNGWREGLIGVLHPKDAGLPDENVKWTEAPYPAGDRRYPPLHPLSPEKTIAAYRSGAQVPKTHPLRAHFKAMQGMASRYLEPAPYVDRDGVEYATVPQGRDTAFINDMIYMLDGPEQRAAEGQGTVAYDPEEIGLETN